MVKNSLINKNVKDSDARRTHVVIETNKEDLALVRLTSKKDKLQSTQLKFYKDGKTYFKHFVEIEDVNKNPLRIGNDITENHKNMDLSKSDISHIYNTIYSSKQKDQFNKKIKKFRSRYKKN